MKVSLVFSLVLLSLLTGCSSYHELKAPCSPFDCKDRVPVNSWPKG